MLFSRNGQIKRAVKEAIEAALTSGEENALKMFSLNKEISTLKEEVEDLKLQKKMEMQEVEHLVKMEREKNKLDLEKESLKMAGEFKDKEMKLQTDYYDKSMKLIQEGSSQMQEMYRAIMERLPNVTMSIKKNINGVE